MFDSPTRPFHLGGHFSLPQLARAAVYHGEGLRAESTLTVSTATLPPGSPHAVAAGAWWAVSCAQEPLGGGDAAFVDWACSRIEALGASRQSTRVLLESPLQARVEAPLAGTALPVGAALIQVTASLPHLVARLSTFQTILRKGVSAATCAGTLAAAANGRPLVDDATAAHADPLTAPFLAWCGRVGGMSGTTNLQAGWSWEVPVVNIPSPHSMTGASPDVLLDAGDIHGSIGVLVERTASGSIRPERVRLNRPVLEDTDLQLHARLRRALDRHGLRRTRICAEVPPDVARIRSVVQSESPIDILVLTEPWWTGEATVGIKLLTAAADAPPRDLRIQLHRKGNRFDRSAWTDEGLLRPLSSPGQPLPATPTALPRRHPLRRVGSIPAPPDTPA